MLALVFCSASYASNADSGLAATADWDSCYFYSGGKNGHYTAADLGKSTQDLQSNPTSGADPSCTTSPDGNFFNKCSVVSTNKKYKYVNAYGSKDDSQSLCKGQATVSLINPDNKGRVACFAHGMLGALNTTCNAGAFPSGVNAELVKQRATAYIAIINNCGDSSHTKKVTVDVDAGLYTCIILQAAFTEAGVENIYPDKSNNGGVALSYGHGVGSGSCGSFSYFRKGGSDLYKNNTTLNLQLGIRSWSGEWSDAFPAVISSGSITDNATQAYIIQPTSSGNPIDACLQPLIQEIDSTGQSPIDTLLKHISPESYK